MTPDQRAKRLHYHLYESCEGIREQSERIVALEELVTALWSGFECGYPQVCDGCRRDGDGTPTDGCKLVNAMRELEIEVDE